MSIDNTLKKLGEWSKNTLINPVTPPKLSCDVIASIDFNRLQMMSLDEFEDLLNQITSYSLYVKAQKGSIEGQIEVVKNDIEKRLYLETNGLSEEYRYKNIAEKISVVRAINEEIDSKCEKLSMLRAQFVRIKDVPYAIDKKLDILTLIYKRRLSNERAIHKS